MHIKKKSEGRFEEMVHDVGPTGAYGIRTQWLTVSSQYKDNPSRLNGGAALSLRTGR